MWSASRQADQQIKDGLRARKKWGLRHSKESNDAALEYLRAHHEFAMTANEVDTGELRVMTGREGKVHNELLKQAFRNEIDRVYPAYVQIPLKQQRGLIASGRALPPCYSSRAASPSVTSMDAERELQREHHRVSSPMDNKTPNDSKRAAYLGASWRSNDLAHGAAVLGNQPQTP
jgi:hypothetical protein